MMIRKRGLELLSPLALLSITLLIALPAPVWASDSLWLSRGGSIAESFESIKAETIPTTTANSGAQNTRSSARSAGQSPTDPLVAEVEATAAPAQEKSTAGTTP